MDKIEKIRQEIERLKTENNNIRCSANVSYCVGYDDAFSDLLSFLDTLGEEPDMDLKEQMMNEHPPILDIYYKLPQKR